MKKYILFSIIVFSALWFFSSATAQAANWYIRQGATGANNGSDWTNAYTSLPATLNRGDTYYIADGTYGGYAFNDPVSDSQYITIKKATISDYGTNTGWSSTYGDGVATFTSQMTISTSYWVFDGVVGSGKTGHGFHVDLTAATWGASDGVYITASNITMAHTKISWPDRDSELYMNPGDGGVSVGIHIYGSYNGIQLKYIYLEEIPGVPVRMLGGDDFLMEYSVMDGNHSDALRHASGLMSIYGNTNNGIARYNKFMNIEGSYVIGLYGGGVGLGVHNNWKIYGNLFIWDNSSAKTDSPSFMISSNMDTGNTINNTVAHNNTFVEIRTPRQTVGKIQLNGTGNYAYNNVFYGMAYHVMWGMTHDYNYYSNSDFPFMFDVAQPHDTPNYEDVNGRHSTITSNPFINSANGDFRLSTALTGYTGATLSSPYNQDMLGNTRGNDGTWDRGAYEYGSGTPPPPDTQAPTVPSNLSAAAVSSSQINLSWTASTDNVGVTGYRIYRLGTQIGTSLSNSYSNTGLIANTTYSYTVSAYDAAGNVSAQSSSASATTGGTAVFNIGDRVQVVSDPSLRVRSAPGLSDATILGNQLKGSLGTVINGPVSLDSYIWWQIDYDVFPDGWSIEPWLVKVGSDITPPAAPSGVGVS